MLERKHQFYPFGVSTALLATFYNEVLCSALTFGIVCRGGNISKHERGRLDKIVQKGRGGGADCWNLTEDGL